MLKFQISALLLVVLSFQLARAATPELSLICSTDPKESGLTLERAGVSPANVNVAGKEDQAWVSGHKSVPADDWARSFLIKVTDEHYRNGKMPAVDIDVVYMHEANTKVELVADTASGGRVVGGAWGNKKEWQTLHCRINDAYFGARPGNTDPKKLPVDGYDLRINAWAGNLYIKSVTVTGHDPNDPDDWSRFIAVDSVTSPHQFIVEPGSSEPLVFKVVNHAKVPAPATASIEIIDGAGKMLSVSSLELTVPAEAGVDLPVTFDASKLPTGEYAVRTELRVGPEKHRTKALTRDQPVVVAGPNDLFIVFDQEPIARGIELDRAATFKKQVTVNGVQQWAWGAGGGSTRGGDPWWTSMFFKVTDERFRDGRMPAADIRAVYRHTNDAPVSLMADTTTASRQVAGGWGRNENWQTMSCQIDDAKFGRTDYKDDPKQLKSDGFDLRFNTCTGDTLLRSIFIHGYDLNQNPDYHRLLRFDGMDAGRDLFVFSPGEKQDIAMKLRNLAIVDLAAEYSVTLNDDLGQQVWTRQEKAAVKGGGAFSLPVAFDTAGLKQGVYTLALSLGRRGADGKYEELIKPEINLMVCDQTPVAKAKDGEFLYGVDQGVGYQDPRWMKWLDLMGCDITRGNGANSNPDEWEAAFAAYDKFNIRNSVFADVPWDANEAARNDKVKKVADRAEALARKFGERAHYWEMGNEPDLNFFYAGPIEAYVKGYSEIARAIKRGNPKAVVMNGGLANMGGDSTTRSNKFVELVPTDAIDAFAFHGHGPGAQSERAAYERIHATAKQFGKADKLFIETESGVASLTPGQIRIQARTAVQKLAYAQSVGLPTLMWFRLNITGGDAGYTNTVNAQQPRPVILSYRTMTRTLKGLAFSRKLDLGSADQEGYLFAAKGSTERAILVWANTRGGGTRTVQIGARPGSVSDVKLIDLFGNITPLPDANSGIVTLPVEMDPSYLAWKSADAAETVAILPSPLEVPPVVSVVSNGPDSILAQLRNPMDHPLDGTLTVQAGAGSGIKPDQPSIAVQVPAQGRINVKVPITVNTANEAIDWPRHWTAFLPVPTDSVDVTQFKLTVPRQISAKGKTFDGQLIALKEDRLDLAPLGGGFAERKEAIVFATLDSAVDQSITIGSSADWWEQWFINGEPVFDTLANGNAGPQSLLEHAFTAKVKAGRNLLAVRVLSGSQGWKLWCGGPQEVAAAKGANSGGGNSLTLELRQGSNVLARQRALVARRKMVQLPGEIAWNGPVTDWDKAGADADIGDENIVNEWAKQPDANKWWKGPADLSGRVWFRADSEKLYVMVAVRDDVHKPAADAAGIELGDAMRLSIADPEGKQLRLGIPGSGSGVFMDGADAGKPANWTPVDSINAAVRVERVEESAGGVTWYRLSLARKFLGTDRPAINAALVDNDWGEHKQTAYWFGDFDKPTPATAQWWQLQLK